MHGCSPRIECNAAALQKHVDSQFAGVADVYYLSGLATFLERLSEGIAIEIAVQIRLANGIQ